MQSAHVIQWRYYGPFCARQSFKGLFWQNGPVFGPFLPPESSFSLNLCKQRNITFLDGSNILILKHLFLNVDDNLLIWIVCCLFVGWGDDESAGLPWWQTDELKTNTKYVSQSGCRLQLMTCKSLLLKFQILYVSFSFLICWWEYILVAFYVNVQFRLGRKRGS